MPFTKLTVVSTILITALRGALFYACYTYLLRSIYHDLQTLAGAPTKNLGGNGETHDDDSDLELDVLPAPSTAKDGPLLTHASATGVEASLRGRKNWRHSRIARLCFSLCFSESCTLFLLFMGQELSLLDPSISMKLNANYMVEVMFRSRILNWRISLFLVLAMILLVIPLTQNFLLTYQSPLGRLSRSRSIPTRIMMALIPYSLYIFALSLIPLPEGLSLNDPDLVSSALERLIVLGTFIIGLLSGLGAARNAWDFMPVFSKSRRRVPTERDIRTAEEALERIRNDVQVRRREERRLQGDKNASTSSWMSRVASSITGSSELTSIQREITGLLALEYQMERNLEELNNLYTGSVYNKTVQGRVLQWAGRLFAVYCVFRTLSCILNILAPFHSSNLSGETKSSYPDLIAHFLTYLFSLLPFVHFSAEHISAIARQVSLGLVGIIILSSVRFVLRAVSRFMKITSQNLGASLMLLILAQLMGTYLISTLVQLRTAFPPGIEPTDGEIMSTNVFSTLPAYEVFGSAFDYSYLMSALATGAYLWADERINGGARLDDT